MRILLFLAMAGCGDKDAAGDTAPAVDSSAAADDTGVGADDTGADTSAADDTDADDTGADTSAADDTGPDDTGPDDTAPPPVCGEAGSERLSGPISLVDADARIEGLAAGDRAGDRVAAGDLDGDGLDEIILGATGVAEAAGAVYVLRAASGGGSVSDARAFVAGEGAEHELGHAVAAVDLNGDGIDALIALAPGAGDVGQGIVWIFDASADGEILLADAAAQIEGGEAGASEELLAGVDLDGDGAAALVVADAAWPLSEGATGAVHLLDAPTGALQARDAAASTWTSGVAEMDISAIADVGDTDGDGRAELAIGVEGWNDPTGGVWLLRDAPGGVLGPDDADASLEGSLSATALGASLAGVGDVNGDGYADLGAGASGWGCFVFYGPVEGALDTNDAGIEFTGRLGSSRHLGSAISGADFDGDGRADIACGAFNGDTDHSGQTYLFYSPEGTIFDVEFADATLTGEASGHLAGYSAAVARDATGDGCPDLLLGAYGYGEDHGAAYALFGGVD